MNDTTKNMRTAEQLAALADTLERQAAAPLGEAAAALLGNFANSGNSGFPRQ